jgi:hypothetical protein
MAYIFKGTCAEGLMILHEQAKGAGIFANCRFWLA